ncbi:hypothetical protein PHYC_01773 [Phycisphaerales bacterium]|nr:hypothetical protein PHYC_01773 [Phycisphaerales bacterium]
MRFVWMMLAGLAVGGCASPSSTSSGDQRGPSTGLNALAAGQGELTLGSGPVATLSDDQKSALAKQAALDLEAYLNSRPDAGDGGAGLNTLAGGDAANTPSPPAPPPVATADEQVLSAAEEAWAAPLPKVTAGGEARNPISFAEPDDPIAGMARKMAELLREVEGKRIPDSVALAAVESLRPGVLADLESPTNELHAKLSEPERAALIGARDRVLAQPSAANDALIKSLSKITRPIPLKIARGALCRRVNGFGRYEPFESDTFAAGRALRAIVYTELDGFSYRPAREGDPAQAGVPLADQHSVELSESLTLYHDPSGLQAWHRPGQRVIETTRGKRRDFYLIHTIELPATLGVGKYILKAAVTDKTTGAMDEVTMPINLVAR